ncbi:MAG: dihydrofolate reductase [Rikenellaceae bacterium]
MISIIVAIANDRVIGNNNQLLWHITEDMRYFRSVTSGHAVVMGRKTYDSIGRPLPKRQNIVITRQDIEIEGCDVAHSLDEALSLIGPENETFIIGGAEIYAMTLPVADRLYITRVGGHFEGDTHFPEWEDDSTWKLSRKDEFPRGVEFEYPFSFEVYDRIDEN